MSLKWMTRVLSFMLLASTQCHALVWAATPKNNYQEPARQNVSRGSARASIELRTDTEGVDFNDYLHDTYFAVKKHWFAKMPGSLVKGQQGTNTIEFRILQDGSVPKDSVKMITSSEKSDFDAASLQAIQEAMPFNHLPEKFSKPFIEVRFTFYYNLPGPPTPH